MSMQTTVHTQPLTKPPITPVTSGVLQRACACGKHTGNGGECEECKKKRQGILQRAAPNAAPVSEVPPIVHEALHSPGEPLDANTRAFMEPRFGHDFSGVRVHADARAGESARAVNALAYTVGNNVVFGTGQYTPMTRSGQQLLAHELAHTLQQRSSDSPIQPTLSVSNPGDPAEEEAEYLAIAVTGMEEARTGSSLATRAFPLTISRVPTFPDETCNSVRSNIISASSTAREWTSNARRRLNNAPGVSGALQTHFKIDPNDTNQAADLATVRQNFDAMLGLFDTDINNRCNPAGADRMCQLPDGRRYAAWVRAGRPAEGITHCLASADAGFLSRESLIETIVHEVAHLADAHSDDFAYRHSNAITSYEAMTRAQAIHNGDSYSEFARDLFIGPTREPLMLGLSTGVLLSRGRPRWAIGVNVDIRSRSGIEVFDLVGGLHGFIGLDTAAPAGQPVVRDLGAELNFGFISRSAQTKFFADTRLGLFGTVDAAIDPTIQEPSRLGISSSTLIGWGNSQFRTSINLRLLYDFLSSNHAMIIGGEFQWGP